MIAKIFRLIRVFKHLPALGFRNGWRFSSLLDRYPNRIQFSSDIYNSFKVKQKEISTFCFEEDSWLNPSQTGWYLTWYSFEQGKIKYTRTLFTTTAMLDYLECALAEADELTQAEQADTLMIDCTEIDTYFLTEEVLEDV